MNPLEAGLLALITSLTILVGSVTVLVRRRSKSRMRARAAGDREAELPSGDAPAHRHNTMSILVDENTLNRQRVLDLETKLLESVKKNADDRERLLKEGMMAIQPLVEAARQLADATRVQADNMKTQQEALRELGVLLRDLRMEVITRGSYKAGR